MIVVVGCAFGPCVFTRNGGAGGCESQGRQTNIAMITMTNAAAKTKNCADAPVF